MSAIINKFDRLTRSISIDRDNCDVLRELACDIVRAGGIVTELEYYSNVVREWCDKAMFPVGAHRILPDNIDDRVNALDVQVDKYVTAIAMNASSRRVMLMYIGVLQDIIAHARAIIDIVRQSLERCKGTNIASVSDSEKHSNVHCSVCGERFDGNMPFYGVTARLFLNRMPHAANGDDEIYCFSCLVYYWDMLRWLNIHPDELRVPRPCCKVDPKWFEECDAKQCGRF